MNRHWSVSSYLKEKWDIIRYVILIALVLAFIAGLVIYSVDNTLLPLDWGRVLSLILTTIVLFLLRIPEEIYNRIDEMIPNREEKHKKSPKDKGQKDAYKSFRAVVILALALTGCIGIWLAIRIILLYVKVLLVEEKYNYSASIIFGIITFVLGANLCFTLSKALEKTATDDDGKDEQVITKLVEVAIQTVIIGFLAVLPRYADPELQSRIGDFSNFITVLIFMVATLVVLLFARKYLATLKTVDPQPVTKLKGKKYCRYCGIENKSDAVFCEKCGKKISET